MKKKDQGNKGVRGRKKNNIGGVGRMRSRGKEINRKERERNAYWVTFMESFTKKIKTMLQICNY